MDLDCILVIHPGASPFAVTRRAFLARAATGALALTCGPAVVRAAQTPAGSNERELIEAAIPARAFAPPRKPRKLLIFDRNVNYGGHGSIPTANLAFELMGRKTGAFETVVSRDPEVFRPESLRQFDGVFFNNCVGNLFTDPALRQSLVEFVYGGGGMMGVHGTSVAFTQWPGAVEDWPEFGLMIGARGANHRASDEQVFIKLDDPAHPVNQAFGGQGFEYRDEFFRVHEPYSRQRVRVLLSIDTDKTDLKQGPRLRPSWSAPTTTSRWPGCATTAAAGRSTAPSRTTRPCSATRRCCRSTWRRRSSSWAICPAPTIPSAMLTPAIRAQEKLGWRLGIEAYTFHKFTLFEAIEKTAALGLPFMGGLSFQKVSAGIPKNFEPGPFRRRTAADPAQARRRGRAPAHLLHPGHSGRRGGLPEGVRVRAQDRHRDLHVRAEARGARHDREVLRRL